MKITRTTITRALGKSAPFHAWRMLGLLSLYLQVLDQTGDYYIARNLMERETARDCAYALRYDRKGLPKDIVLVKPPAVHYIPVKRSSVAGLIDFLTSYLPEDDE